MSSPVLDYAGNAGRSGYAALFSMVDIAAQTFGGFERLTRLNLQTIKTMLAEQHGIALATVDSRSLDWMLTLPTAQAQAGFKKTLAYWHHVNEIAVETAAQNAGAGWESFRECTQWLASSASEAARARSSGSSLLLAAAEASLAAPDATVDEAPLSGGSKSSGKKHSVDLVDASGHVVSSAKQ